MALTVALQQLEKIQVQGAPYGTTNYLQLAKLTFDTSYPSPGGYPITPSQFNLNGILGMLLVGTSGPITTTFIYDAANSALRAYVNVVSSTGSISTTLSQLLELQNGYSLNNVSATFLIIGA